MDLNRWRETAANNNAAVPDGAPEGWTGADVNNWGREQMAAVYRWYQFPEWIDITFGLATYGAKTLSKLSDTQFRIASADARTTVSGNPGYIVGRRVRLVQGSNLFDGFITVVAFTAGNTDVTVALDSGVVPATIDATYVHLGSGLAKIAFRNDPENIDDSSATNAEQDTVVSPGTYAVRSLATTLEGETHRQRYATSRLAVGVGVTRNNGSAAANWIEKPARGQSRTLNGRFAIWSGTALDAPTHWTKVGTPTTLETVARATTAGLGREVHFVADASGEGVSQAVSGLQANSLYLVRAVARADVGAPVLSTTGGTGAVWGNFSAAIATSEDAEYLGIVLTDATPTAIALRVLSTANGDDAYVSEFDLIPLGDAPRPGVEMPLGWSDFASKTAAETVGTGSWSVPSNLTAPIVHVPGPGYDLIVRARVAAAPSSSSNSNFGMRIEQSFNGGAFAAMTDSPTGGWSNDTARAASAETSAITKNAAVGSYVFRVAVQPVSNNFVVSPSVATLGQLSSQITWEVRYRG